MPCSIYRRFLLHPLFRRRVLSLGVAGFCAGCLFLAPFASPLSCAPEIAAAAATGGPVSPADNRAEWPHTLLRLWFLLPQLLSHDS